MDLRRDSRAVTAGAIGVGMTQPAKGQEPSMEEILASIRRIIADDPARTARPEKEARREGDSGSAPGVPVSAQANASRSVPAADASKASSATISSLRSPQNRIDEENPALRSPMPQVASIEEETDADILATDEDAEVDPAAAEADAEEEHEEPGEQI